MNRYYGHFEGDATTYRAPGEVEKLRRESDCLARFRRRVTAVAAGGAGCPRCDRRGGRRRPLTAASPTPRRRALPVAADLLTDVYVAY